MNINLKCNECNKVIVVPKKERFRKYCDSICYGKSRKGFVCSDRTKKRISKAHKGKKLTIGTKNKISKTRKKLCRLGIVRVWNKGLDISDQRVVKNIFRAKRTIRKQFRDGRKPHNWNGGKKNWKIFKYNGTFQTLRKILIREDPLCICGKEAILIHHKDFDSKNDIKTNLQSLCRKCHKLIHRRIYEI